MSVIIVLSLVGTISVYYIVRKRKKKTEFQKYLKQLNKTIHNKIHKNSNPYLATLFMSFSGDTAKEKETFEKLREQRMSLKSYQSDPLLPPFENGVFVTEISASHSLLFDLDPTFKGQMLICTKDFEYQNLLLTPQDMEACFRFIVATNGFVLFKSNEKVGSKFNHKHIHA